jgi:hypothetical protein
MTWKDQVLIVDTAIIGPMQETMVLNVITWPIDVIAKLNAIAKIRKYRGHHEGHHFIPMAMEVHGALERDMNCFIWECAHLFHNR